MAHNQNQSATSPQSASGGPSEVDQAYNPAQSGDGPAAKLWELLRRNPAFREDAAWMVAHSVEPEARKKVSSRIRALVSSQFSVTDRFAGYVLRWFGEPSFLKPKQILDIMFGVEVAKIFKEDLALHIFGLWMSNHDDEWKNYRNLGIVPFMKVCPLYLLRGQNMWRDKNQGLFLKLVLPDFLKKDYPGKLVLSGGNFNLDTPWPQTPKLFRDHFTWLWANFDANTTNPYTGDRKLLPRPASLGLFGEYNLQDQNEKLYPRLFKEFIYVVPSCFHTEVTIKEVCSDFESHLKNEFRSLQISRKKYSFLFGGQAQWEAFSFVRDRTTYSSRQDRTPFMSVRVPFDRQGSGKAIDDFEDAKKLRKEWSMKSKQKGHIENGYEQMENLMMATYPGLDFHRIVNLLHPGWSEKIIS